VRKTVLAGLLALLVLVLGACSGSEADDAKFHGDVLDNPYTVPDTTLTDTEGEPFSLASDTDKRLTLVFFGYTHCVDSICPTVLGSLASALTRLDDEDRSEIDVVFVTTDPERDTEQVLREYLDRFDPSFIGLTGDLDTIIEIGDALAIGVDKVDPGGHTTATMGIDSDDESPVYWGAETSSAQFASDIHSLLREE
jgi:protein SCO1/2